MKKIITTLALACLIFTNVGCKKKLFKKITFEGVVYDHKTNGVPVAGIKVTLKACGGGSGDKVMTCSYDQFTIGEATTDASGHFYIHNKAASSDVYFVYTTPASKLASPDGVYGKDLNSRYSEIYLAP
jgi:hypothetical protein